MTRIKQIPQLFFAGLRNIGGDLLHQNSTPSIFEFFVKYMFTIWFLRYLFDPLTTLSQIPVEYSDPVGWVRWLPASAAIVLHSFWGLLILKIILLASCIGVWFDAFRVRSAIAGCIMLTTVNAVVRGFGHANHCEIGPLIVTWILTIFLVRMSSNPNGKKDRVQPDTSAATGLITATLALGLCYAFVGIARLTNGGFELFAGDTIINHVVRASHNDWVLGYDFSRIVTQNPWIGWTLKLGTLAVTFLEIAVPFALVSRRIRWAVLIVMPAFHLGAMLLFKVIFVEQMLTLLLFVNVGPILTKVSTLKQRGVASQKVMT